MKDNSNNTMIIILTAIMAFCAVVGMILEFQTFQIELIKAIANSGK